MTRDFNTISALKQLPQTNLIIRKGRVILCWRFIVVHELNQNLGRIKFNEIDFFRTVWLFSQCLSVAAKIQKEKVIPRTLVS